VPQGLEFEALGFSSRSFARLGRLSKSGGASPVKSRPKLWASFNIRELMCEGAGFASKKTPKTRRFLRKNTLFQPQNAMFLHFMTVIDRTFRHF
jgi:hypothetical protein